MKLMIAADDEDYIGVGICVGFGEGGGGLLPTAGDFFLSCSWLLALLAEAPSLFISQ